MRISDWSSDVCSSDLGADDRPIRGIVSGAAAPARDALAAITPLPERGAVDAETFAREIVPAYRPVVLRGQVADWPAVAAGASPPAAAAYIPGFANDRPDAVLSGTRSEAGSVG